jgi:hypothetical protein
MVSAQRATPVSAKNSALDAGVSRRHPCRAEVTVRDPIACTPAERHAGVFGLQHDPDGAGAQLRVQPVGDLLGEPLLDLGPGGEVLDQAAQLGQAEDPVTNSS